MKKYLVAFISLGVLLFSSHAEALRVTVLTAEEGGAYQDFYMAFAGEVQRQKMPLNVLQASSLPFDTDLVIAVGIKSALIASKGNFPVLSVLVSKAGFEKLLGELPATRKKDTFSAIYFDQPIKRQIAMVVAALPEARNIGLLLSAHSPDISNLRKEAHEKKLGLNEQQLGSEESLYQDLESVLQDSDVLLAIPDAEVYNSLTMRNILLATYRSKVPVVGFSPAYVRAGALCAVFSTPSQIAMQAAYLAKQFIGTNILPSAQYPADFDVLVNQQVARSLGILIKENAVLISQIKAATTKEGGD